MPKTSRSAKEKTSEGCRLVTFESLQIEISDHSFSHPLCLTGAVLEVRPEPKLAVTSVVGRLPRRCYIA